MEEQRSGPMYEEILQQNKRCEIYTTYIVAEHMKKESSFKNVTVSFVGLA